jgi:hypothetical protein
LVRPGGTSGEYDMGCYEYQGEYLALTFPSLASYVNHDLDDLERPGGAIDEYNIGCDEYHLLIKPISVPRS